MKAKIAPVYFGATASKEFATQLGVLQRLLGEEAELLAPRPLGASTEGADAVVVPEMLGEAYRRLADFRSIRVPILVVTSEFGTVSMWDWEINSYLRSKGVEVLAPYNLAADEDALQGARGQARPCQEPPSGLPGQSRSKASRPASSSASTGGSRSARSGCSRSSASP